MIITELNIPIGENQDQYYIEGADSTVGIVSEIEAYQLFIISVDRILTIKYKTREISLTMAEVVQLLKDYSNCCKK